MILYHAPFINPVQCPKIFLKLKLTLKIHCLKQKRLKYLIVKMYALDFPIEIISLLPQR